MSVYERLLFPMLRRMEPERAHAAALRALARAQESPAGRTVLRGIAGEIPDQPVQLWGLTFPNVLGVAAGYDKDARIVPGLALLGFGHIEVGTVTPWPQPGNPRPRVLRVPEEGALINRMGFPNDGMVAIGQRLKNLAEQPREYVIGVSLGKQKETPLDRAVTDYVSVMRAVYRFGDYLAVNISSPNTPGLRQLQGRAYLEDLIGQLTAENRNLAYVQRIPPRPLLVKIAPDLTQRELEEVLDVALAGGIDGLIATNTTTSRANLAERYQREEGGLSGRPLAERSTELIAFAHDYTRGALPIIGVGGVFTAADAHEKLRAGASLVQVYTGLVYEGPRMPGNVLRELAAAGMGQTSPEPA